MLQFWPWELILKFTLSPLYLRYAFTYHVCANVPSRAVFSCQSRLPQTLCLRLFRRPEIKTRMQNLCKPFWDFAPKERVCFWGSGQIAVHKCGHVILTLLFSSCTLKRRHNKVVQAVEVTDNESNHPNKAKFKVKLIVWLAALPKRPHNVFTMFSCRLQLDSSYGTLIALGFINLLVSSPVCVWTKHAKGLDNDVSYLRTALETTKEKEQRLFPSQVGFLYPSVRNN